MPILLVIPPQPSTTTSASKTSTQHVGMKLKGSKGKKKQRASPSSDEDGKEDIPGELLPDLRSLQHGLQAVVNAMLQNQEQVAPSSSPEVRSPGQLNTNSHSKVTPYRTSGKNSIPNFSRPLTKTPTTSETHTPRAAGTVKNQNPRRLNTSNALSTPTNVKFTASKAKMENTTKDDAFNQGQVVTANSSTPVNRVLDFSDEKTKDPVSRTEQKKKMDVYLPVKMIFTKELWQGIDTNLEELHLDLFWPKVQAEPRDGDVFPLEDLEPLCNFRQLRSLKITGMMESYQKYIWQAAWLNPHLKELALEMALEPNIRKGHDKAWPTIKGAWRLEKLEDIKPSYHGDKGEGVLRHSIGYGEYLDTFAILNAKKEAQAKGPVTEKLPIATLRLTGFVVDADPFKRWFDPEKLREIDFTNDCIDAGFGLPVNMLQKIKITYPGDETPKVLQAQAFKLSDVKLITLKKSKKVAEEPAFPQFTEVAKAKRKSKASGGPKVGEGSKEGINKAGPSNEQLESKKEEKVAEEPAFPQFTEVANTKKKGKSKARGESEVGESSKEGSSKAGPSSEEESKKEGDSSQGGENSRGSEA